MCIETDPPYFRHKLRRSGMMKINDRAQTGGGPVDHCTCRSYGA